MSTKAQALTLPAPNRLSKAWMAVLLVAMLMTGLLAGFLATRGSSASPSRIPRPVPGPMVSVPSDSNYHSPTCPQCQ